jgi:NitT/TauT family transport system substrate-binding protein
MHRRPAPALIVALAATLVALAGCADDDAAADQPRRPIPITVGVIPIIDTAPVYLGIKKGFFEAQGLEVTPVPAAGGAVLMPAVITGQNEFGFSNVVSLLAARDAGLPLISVAAGASSTGSPSEDVVAVLADEESTLRRPRDLAGKKVAINALNNIGDTTIRTAVERDGGDPDAVEFVEVPFPEMPQQLKRGDIDAAWAPDPFRSQILAGGGRILFNSLTATYPRVQIAQYFTSESFRNEHPEIVRAFVTALNQSLAYAADHPEECRKVLSTYTKITPAVASQVVLPHWPQQLDRQSTLALGAAAHKYGSIQDLPDIEGLFGDDG